MDTTNTKMNETPKLTLFGTIVNTYNKLYNKVCEESKRISDVISCNITGNIASIKSYIDTEIVNKDEREYLRTKVNEYSKTIQEITKDVKDTTIKTVHTLKKRAYTPENPREALHALYLLEGRIINMINDILEIPSIDVETIEGLLELDTSLSNNQLNKLIELIFNLYNKNVLGNNGDVSVSKTQKMLFVGYLFCEPLRQDDKGTNLEETPIPYLTLLNTQVMSGDEINKEFERICKFEKEVNIEDIEQPPATTVFERIPLEENVVMVKPSKKRRTEGGNKTSNIRTKNKKKKNGKTKKNKQSLKKKVHKKK